MTLSDLEHDRASLITHIGGEAGSQTRLLHLGVIPGAEAKVLRSAPFGDPMQVRIEGTLLSIRRHDAQHIQVEHV